MIIKILGRKNPSIEIASGDEEIRLIGEEASIEVCLEGESD